MTPNIGVIGVGGVAGRLTGSAGNGTTITSSASVRFVSAESTIKGDQYVGGVIGVMDAAGTVTSAYAFPKFRIKTSATAGTYGFGGIVGGINAASGTVIVKYAALSSNIALRYNDGSNNDNADLQHITLTAATANADTLTVADVAGGVGSIVGACVGGANLTLTNITNAQPLNGGYIDTVTGSSWNNYKGGIGSLVGIVKGGLLTVGDKDDSTAGVTNNGKVTATTDTSSSKVPPCGIGGIVGIADQVEFYNVANT